MAININNQLREEMTHDATIFPITFFHDELALMAFLALTGDLGATVSPALVGSISEMAGSNLKMGLLVATVFPVVLIADLMVLKKWYKNS